MPTLLSDSVNANPTAEDAYEPTGYNPLPPETCEEINAAFSYDAQPEYSPEEEELMFQDYLRQRVQQADALSAQAVSELAALNVRLSSAVNALAVAILA